MLHAIVSKGQSNNPKKRELEDALIDRLDAIGGVRVVITPNLYDLPLQSEGMDVLRSLEGDLIVLSWNFPRAAHWMLDRCAIQGDEGVVELIEEPNDDEDDDWEADLAKDGDKQRVVDQREKSGRKIYCINLAVTDDLEQYEAEVRRIIQLSSAGLMQWLQGQATTEQLDRYLEEPAAEQPAADATAAESMSPLTIEGSGARRWYPVIDFSQCTNCMECIDFCLFGVYGVDGSETILVEQPDNCRKGCPACSRVCPENAIIFPQHKSPAIAGSPGQSASLKIDLSELFGGGGDAVEVAAKERDEQLLLAGRNAVGMTIGIPKRQDSETREKDDLDSLLDELDELDV